MTRRRAELLLLAAAAVWGVSFVVVKEALSAASPLLFLALRFTIATAALTPFVQLRGGFSRAELRAGLILTLLLASGFATQAYGLQYTNRTGWLVVLALLLAGAGIYFLTSPDAGGLNRGDLWTLITAAVFGGHIVAVSEFSRQFDAQRLVWLQLPGTAIASLLGALLLEQLRFEWSPGIIAALLFLAIMSTVVALVWQFSAQREMSSARASLIFCFEPVFAAITSRFFWGEQFSLSQGFGAAMILAGMVLAVLGEARSERVPVAG